MPPVEALEATGKLPAQLVDAIESPRGYVETSAGTSLILDGSTHSVYAVDANRTRSKRIIQIGAEPGRILNPSGFSLGPNDLLAVSDAPGGLTRIQYFDEGGRPINSFYVAAQPGARVSMGRVTLRGAGSLAFTGKTFLVNWPTTDALISEFDATGDPVRSIGVLRPTGHEQDRALHAALNTGSPFAASEGGVYFVFETGVPIFRRYDARGALVFERHIEGAELDPLLSTLPSRWPARKAGEDVWPLVPSFVRTAAVDPKGRLWVALATGVTYVFDEHGDKIRTVRFMAGAGAVNPQSFFFAQRNRLLITPGCYEFRID